MGLRAVDLWRWRVADAAFLGLTLVASAVHFLDNALRLDLYPGPVWLTRRGVLAAWVVLLLLGYLTYRRGTRTVLIAYAALGFGGLAHYLEPGYLESDHPMPARCVVTIFAEAVASVLLIAYAVVRPTMRGRP